MKQLASKFTCMGNPSYVGISVITSKSREAQLASIIACASNLLTRASNACNSSCLAKNLARYAFFPMRAVNLLASCTVMSNPPS